MSVCKHRQGNGVANEKRDSCLFFFVLVFGQPFLPASCPLLSYCLFCRNAQWLSFTVFS